MALIGVLTDLPLFGPALGFVALLAAMSARALGRVLVAPAWLAFGLVVSLGLIAATTLTPTSLALSGPWLSTVSNGCHVGSLHVPSWTNLTELNETSLNVLLFLPLGMACGLLRNLGQIAAAALGAALVPLGIEFIQDTVPELGRVCTTDDVMANVTGLAIGLTAGLVVNTARLAVRAEAAARR